MPITRVLTQETETQYAEYYSNKCLAELVILNEIAEKQGNSLASKAIKKSIESKSYREKVDYICDMQEEINRAGKSGKLSRAEQLRERRNLVYSFWNS